MRLPRRARTGGCPSSTTLRSAVPDVVELTGKIRPLSFQGTGHSGGGVLVPLNFLVAPKKSKVIDIKKGFYSRK